MNGQVIVFHLDVALFDNAHPVANCNTSRTIRNINNLAIFGTPIKNWRPTKTADGIWHFKIFMLIVVDHRCSNSIDHAAVLLIKIAFCLNVVRSHIFRRHRKARQIIDRLQKRLC